jgi:hypothetical protein
VGDVDGSGWERSCVLAHQAFDVETLSVEDSNNPGIGSYVEGLSDDGRFVAHTVHAVAQKNKVVPPVIKRRRGREGKRKYAVLSNALKWCFAREKPFLARTGKVFVGLKSVVSLNLLPNVSWKLPQDTLPTWADFEN